MVSACFLQPSVYFFSFYGTIMKSECQQLEWDFDSNITFTSSIWYAKAEVCRTHVKPRSSAGEAESKSLCWTVHSNDKRKLSSGHCFGVKRSIKKILGWPLFVLYILTGSRVHSSGCFCSYFRATTKKSKPLITQQHQGFSQKSLHNGHESFPMAKTWTITWEFVEEAMCFCLSL